MPLDLFPEAKRNLDAIVATQPGYDGGETTFGEGFGAAWKSVAGSWRELRVQASEVRHAQDWVSSFQKATGYDPVQLDFRQPGPAQYDAMRKAYDAEKLKNPGLDLPEPPTQETSRAAAIDAERKLLGNVEAISRRPRGGGFETQAGLVLGGIAGAATDPINLAAIVTTAGSGGILATALREAAIGGVSQTAISVAGLKLSREVDPNYGLGDVLGEVGSAAAGGFILGGGLRAAAQAWGRISRVPDIPAPRTETAPTGLPESVQPISGFHGTNAEFENFDNAAIKTEGALGKGFYFTQSADEAKLHGDRVIGADIYLRNPASIEDVRRIGADSAKLQKAGFDGINFVDDKGKRTIVAFSADQIKPKRGPAPEPPPSEGMVRLYHSGSVGEGDSGRWVSTDRTYASNYRGDLPLHYLDVPANDPRVNNPDYADQGVKQGHTFNFELTPAEATQLKQISRPSAPDQPPADIVLPETVVEADLFPQNVRDAGNVVTREAGVAEANPYRGGGPEADLSHTRNYKAAEAAITSDKPLDIQPDQFTAGTWRPSEVIDSSGRKVGVRYEVVEASDLVASHNPDLSINPAYPAELQPRDRTRAVSADQITGIASRLEPGLLGPSADAAHGAPIVGPDNVIESGNGRVLALGRAYGTEGGLAPNWNAADKSYLFKHVSIGKVGGEAKPFDPAGGPGHPAARKLVAENDITYYERRGAITAVDKDSDVVGVLKPSMKGGQLVIDHIVVSPWLQRQGIGTRMLQLAEKNIPGLRTDLTTGLQSPGGAGVLNKFNRVGGRANAYRAYLEEQGFDVAGMKEPVLIARRTTPLEGADRAAFTDAANRASVLRMSAPEQAMADGRLIDAPLIEKLTTGGAMSGNRDFVRAFIGKLPKEERGGLMDREGNLSQEGQRRVEAALLARAYGDPALLSKILESTDSNVKALAGALTDNAARWTAMRDAVARGDIPSGMDITRDLLDAFRLVAKARDEGVKLKMLVDQAEMFDAPTPTTKALLKLMFRNEDMTQASSRQGVARGLAGYAEEALKNTTDDRLFGEALGAGDVLATALKKAGREDLTQAAEQATLPLVARKTMADPKVDDASIHQLEHLMADRDALAPGDNVVPAKSALEAIWFRGQVTTAGSHAAALEKLRAQFKRDPAIDAAIDDATDVAFGHLHPDGRFYPSDGTTPAEMQSLRDRFATPREGLMIADPTGRMNADGTPVRVSVKSLIDEADAEIAAAQEIGDCAIGKMTPVAA